MVVQYKCPNCGSDMTFDSTSGTLHCDNCGREDRIESMQQETSEPEETVFGNDEPAQYHCVSCGAVILTDANTTATSCSFCGASVVLGDRLDGSLMPVQVIPFKINKKEAQAAFRKWCGKGLLTPSAFRKADRVKSVTGIYVPFWLYDLKGIGEMNASCTKVRHYREGSYDCTETKYYDVYRQADLDYLKVPVDASQKMNDTLMDKLEPFNYNDIKPFSMPYLSGYIAEKYDLSDQDLYPRVQARTNAFVDSYIRATIQGYSSVHCTRKEINISGLRKADYTLFPIWMVCYDYQDSEHIFAMNGQTGKIVGKPPISKGRVAAWFSGIAAASFGILMLAALIIGGISK